MKFGKFLLGRIILSLPILLGVTFFSFLLGVIAPSDPALVILTLDGNSEPTQAELAAMQAQLGLDQPYWWQFGRWLGHVLQGDFGNSYITSIPVWQYLWERFPVTLVLAMTALCWVIFLAIPGGIWAATKVNRWQDRCLRSFAMLASALPGFWLSIVLIHYFAEKWRILPSNGYGSWDQLVLPGFVLAAGTMAMMIRLQRSALLDVLGAHFILTEKSQGLSNIRILWRHAVPNSWLSVVTLIGTYAIGILGGSVVVESIFSLPGLGSLVLTAIRSRDYPVIQGYVLFVGILVVLINLLVDISYFFLNPRSRGGDDR